MNEGSSRRRTTARSDRASSELNRWYPAIGAAAVLIGVIAVGVVADGRDDPGSVPPVVTNSTTPQVVTESTETPIVKLPLSQTFGRGAAGPEVKLIQDRLLALKFDPGVADGAFGERTQQAVWAFEKLVMGVPRDQVTGRVTPEMWSRMQDPSTRRWLMSATMTMNRSSASRVTVRSASMPPLSLHHWVYVT